MSIFPSLIHRLSVAVGLVALLALAGSAVHAATLTKQNLTQLIAESESIICGTVDRVTDGINENGIPYTEVTIAVSDAAKGSIRAGSTYRFRQFGLQRPRKLPRGRLWLAVAPDGFPRWAVGEQVVAFMYEPASRTGFQTTAGLAQGKLLMLEGRVLNEFNNEGLFAGVRIREGLLTENERAMMSSAGAVDAATFIGLVGRAVNENWIETGEMR